MQVIDGASIWGARAQISMDRFGSSLYKHLRIKKSRSLASRTTGIKCSQIFPGSKYIHTKLCDTEWWILWRKILTCCQSLGSSVINSQNIILKTRWYSVKWHKSCRCVRFPAVFVSIWSSLCIYSHKYDVCPPRPILRPVLPTYWTGHHFNWMECSFKTPAMMKMLHNKPT